MIYRIKHLARLLWCNPQKPYFVIHKLIGFPPHNLELYNLALIHRSASERGDRGKSINNERLEFLGDAILDAVIADILYQKYPHQREGFLTNTRSKIVQRDTLNTIAVQLGLPDLIRIAPHFRNLKGSIYGNALEALIGAIYLDQGYERTRSFVEKRIIEPHLNLDMLTKQELNFKSKLIEWAQQNHVPIQFDVLDTTPQKEGLVLFESRVQLGTVYGDVGQGMSKKESQQAAARKTFQRIRRDQTFRDKVIQFAATHATSDPQNT